MIRKSSPLRLERLADQANICFSQLYEVGHIQKNEELYLKCLDNIVQRIQSEGYGSTVPNIIIRRIGLYHQYRMNLPYFHKVEFHNQPDGWFI